MRILVKLGGTLLDDASSRQRLAGELAQVRRDGHELVVVHGGGKQMTRFLDERGVVSRFVNGLRVTTPDVIDAVLSVVRGRVNGLLVAALGAAGARAVGLSGVDAGLVEAVPLGDEYGLVGRPVGGDPALVNLLVAAGYVPVIACVAGDRAGAVYNVNADQLAVACAVACRVERLLFLTDVDGVRAADGTVLPMLTTPEAEWLVASGVATGGMQAKLEAATNALRRGIHGVVIAPGARPGVTSSLLAGGAAGTTVADTA